MKRHWKKLVYGAVALVVVVIAASFIYTQFINDPPERKTEQDAIDLVTTTAAGTTGGTVVPDGSGAATSTVAFTGDPSDPSGNWAPSSESELCYRVKESLNGFDTEGVGCSNSITGSLVIDGTTVAAAEFVVDMATFSSGESRRDGQFEGRIMDIAQFPTGTFTLAAPIDFGAVPADGESVTVTATGDLTLHGVTKSVTFELTAAFGNNKIGVFGNIPVLFSDYGIPNPSFATVSTEDNGLLEFVLAFQRA
ncbi:MAG: YceI family protein [Actinomycetota bacterium]|nr:YceI family protein [Actinomycetota bacterium]